jgi:hypothetical protein
MNLDSLKLPDFLKASNGVQGITYNRPAGIQV